MDPLIDLALNSWSWSSQSTLVLAIAGGFYLRGWLRGRQLLRTSTDGYELAAFFGGLFLLFLALESPLDAFDSLYLSAHMAQHLLLMMFAPALVLLGRPTLPMLRGLPKKFVKEGLGPFLSWPWFKRLTSFLVWPPFAWTAFIVSTVVWHVPWCYELALRATFWHGVQHASFFWTGILFWWPIIEPTPAKPHWPLWTKIPYLLFADIVNTALSAFFVFSGRALYPSYSAIRLGALSASDDQTIAGLIMWVPGSAVYLVPAFVIAMRLLSNQNLRSRPTFARVRQEGQGRRLNWRSLSRSRPALQFAMLLLALVVVVDGWFGPQITPLNLSGVLPWIHWRALSIVALLAIGNLFCMSCPFILVRDLGRRVLPARLRWPRSLRNKWLPASLFVLYLWCYEAFHLWDRPFTTAWIMVGYFAAAVLVDGLFRGASFCKYVCPIGQFHFISSLVSPREVTIKNPSTCQSCRTYDCIRGRERTRGCELYLFQPKKVGNLDCTFCLDCIQACPHDNVGVLPVLPAKTIADDSYRSSIGRLSKRTDLAAFAVVFIFGAFANAAGMAAPVMTLEHAWHARLGPNTMPLIIGVMVLLSVVLLPVSAVLACAGLNSLLRNGKTRIIHVTRRLVFTLVPLGVAMWAAHLLYHFASGWKSIGPIIEQRFFQGGGQIAVPSVPEWLTAAQLVLLDAGVLFSLYLAWRVVQQVAAGTWSAVCFVAPWAVLAVALYGAGAWIFFQPMQMRGMIH